MIKKVMTYIFKISKIYILTFFILINTVYAEDIDSDFNIWVSSYKEFAFKKGITRKTLDIAFKNVKFLDQVIKYDRKQPEFIEDTTTYVNKRANISRAKKAKNLLKKNKNLFTNVENEFSVEKEILLALWGIETNFGKHVGKMDIISCLATLSFDKRRRDFFSSQLLTLLKLIDDNIVDVNTLYGSWAGAYGNFQFMPSTIKSYAIDYDSNNIINLKTSLDDSLASAANYISKIGWKKNQPCFIRVKLEKEINNKYINLSARNISNKLKISKWKKKGVIKFDGSEFETNLKAALISPDGVDKSPKFLVFDNYEKILKWNRSLRFGISVCTLANMIKI